ncbi:MULTISPECIES: TetR/AcrR family transcriptional regulator [unclassified Aeromicrobium]|uniref:TetR/AcrR family transcriptional regulator n=1 Tax=unclassified Aeromicrobium TaxID=2633570 RepID=UPI00396B41D7
MAERKQRPRGDRTRARLLDAARAEFAQHGFGGASTRGIAERAGISASALYAHHRSKEELLFLIAKEGHESALHGMQRVLATQTGPGAQFVGVMRALSAGHAREQFVSHVLANELDSLNSQHFAEVAAVRRAMVGLVRAIIDRGVELELFESPQIDMTVTALFSLCVDVARWYRPDGRWTPEEIGDHFALLGLRMLNASPEVIDAAFAAG